MKQKMLTLAGAGLIAVLGTANATTRGIAVKQTAETAAIAASEAQTVRLAREPQPGDDRGGKGNPVQVAREPQPGDDRGGKGNPVQVARELQPGDDRGGKGNEPQPGDDRGGRGKPVRMA